MEAASCDKGQRIKARGTMALVPRAVTGRPRVSGPVDLELPEGVAVLGCPCRAVHAHVAAAAGDAERLCAAGSGRGGVDRRPVGAVVRGLYLEGLGVRGFPLQDDLADRVRGAEVDLEPLRVAERRGPAGAGVAVGGVRRGERGVLLRG